jgi:hypothetical protein
MANLGVRFAVELGALALLAYWGFHAFQSTAARLGFGIGAPLLLAVLWGLVASPQAPIRLDAPLKVALQIVLLLVPAVAVGALGRPLLAGAFGATVVANAALLEWWNQ